LNVQPGGQSTLPSHLFSQGIIIIMKSIPETRAQQAVLSETAEPTDQSAAPARIDRRQNILAASQRLFARLGYHGVTIRQIAEEAHVPLALVGYYFGQKQELYDAVFGHWSGMVRERLADLQAALEAAGGDGLARIVDALVLPSARLRETPEGRSYALLVTRGLSQQGQEEDRAIREFFDPLAREFINAMHEALAAEFPGAARAQTAWCYQFALGALLHHLSDQRIERLSDGANVPADPSVATQLSAFITAGIRGAMTSFANCATEQAAEA
jgi:AcrR family transcriptional regulator